METPKREQSEKRRMEERRERRRRENRKIFFGFVFDSNPFKMVGSGLFR